MECASSAGAFAPASLLAELLEARLPATQSGSKLPHSKNCPLVTDALLCYKHLAPDGAGSPLN